MKNLYEKDSCITLLNESIDILTYFSKELGEFIVLDYDEEIEDDYILLPYSEEIEQAYMRSFLQSKGKNCLVRSSATGFISSSKEMDGLMSTRTESMVISALT